MTVELISVGTELLLGNIVNTNANYLSKKCAELGLSLFYQITVGDNENRLIDTVKTAMSRSDIIILTGGLGPTQDDLTKEAVAKALGRKLVMDEHSRERILKYFDRISYDKQDNQIQKASAIASKALSKITDNNWKQALKIDDCFVIDNDNGTAPGYIIKENHKIIFLLPGPPSEMIPMFEQKMFPYLKETQQKVFISKMVKICGIGESRAETRILDLIEKQTNPTIAPYAKSGEVHFRITASADNENTAESMIQPLLKELMNRFGDNIYTTSEEETLEDVVVKLLQKQGLKLVTAESCTGGLLTGRIVNIPGASSVFTEGFITYSNESKMKYLGVDKKTLDQYGAVSEETATQMVKGAADTTGCEAALAITGIAGPDGGTKEKPIGLVYIGCYLKGIVTVREYRLRGNREKIREQSVIHALDLLRRCLMNMS
ncbi:competence/damage-inducible protein A [Mobilitalea sibirica]|uniref:Putative competence-damage inducible protein n=1 Tax=Mobilitalea sibirica TaxID=1462919 RepID=A0A8J7H576_9FIRM|nr:competence/damage-inducible protein A [Mobilitalea sibirica]MBH1942377.1 competence/damage-inducible protein A [Mobilitalea sibirica]